MFGDLALLSLAALSASFATDPGSDSISIPLSGTLQARCSARVHDIEVTPGSDLKVTLFIDHGCNKGHTLLLRVRQGSGADLTRTRTTYGGRGPNHTTPSDMSFRYSEPVTQSGLMTITLANPTDLEREALLQTLTVSVLAD